MGLYSIICLVGVKVVQSKLIDKWLKLRCHFLYGEACTDILLHQHACIFTHKMLTKHDIKKLFHIWDP